MWRALAARTSTWRPSQEPTPALVPPRPWAPPCRPHPTLTHVTVAVTTLSRVRGRAVREGKPFDAMLPKGLEPPQLVARIVPDPDDEEYGLEVGEA